MAKYHITPGNGTPNICKARVGKCPFASDDEHYPTKAAALAAFEGSMSGATFGQKLKDGAVLHGVSDYRLAPPGTVVVFENGVRFIKTTANQWETSAEGGLLLQDEEAFDYATNASEGSPRGRVVVEGASALKGKAPIKASLFQQSAFEAGNQARKYFLLLNHRDPAMVASLDGKVKDQAVIDSVKNANRLEDEVGRLEESLEKAVTRRNRARTDKQREAYAELVRRDAEKLSAAKASLEAARVDLDKHMKRYARQHVLHARSIQTLERIANNGVRYRPPGYENRVAQLEALVANRKPVRELYTLAQSEDTAKKLEAAKAFGNPSYIASTQELHNVATEAKALDATIKELKSAQVAAPTEKVKNTIQEELLEKAKRREQLNGRLEAANKRVSLFMDDLRDRDAMDDFLKRELAVLKRLGGAA